MPGLSWGIPATRCRIGSILAEQKGTVCEGCYARKGTYAFGNVQKKLEERYRGLLNELWTPAMVADLRINTEAGDYFRFFDSGDLQGPNHLANIIRIASAVRDVCFWLPTREASLLRDINPRTVPENLRVRLSGNMIDGPVPQFWPWTSAVVSDPEEATCPTSINGGSCADHDCRTCWDETPTVKYLRH